MIAGAPRQVAVIGAGVIGAGWAARFLMHGVDVTVHDPGPGAEAAVARALANARASLPALFDAAMPGEGRLAFAPDIAGAVAGADWVQESVPETLEAKRRVIAAIQAANPGAVLASSTSGFRPSVLQEHAPNPGSLLVAHPFNPVYLLPLVEVVPGAGTDPGLADRAVAALEAVGMHPLRLDREIDAHVADRLLEALWREALWLVRDGVATTAEIDDALRMGPGLRWAQMGLFETYRIAGGAAGMRHFLAQFGPALAWPWSRLTDVPEMDELLVETIATQSDAQSGAHSVEELERIRDANLVGILRSLRDRDWGAGRVLRVHDARLAEAAPPAEADATGPLELARMTVLPAWIDYNGHMTESRYLFACSETTDALLRLIGVDLDYVATGRSYYTVETHIMHRGEAKLGERLVGSVQILGADEKRLHVFVRLRVGDREVATLEQMLLHVDARAGRAAPADPAVLARLLPIAEAHRSLARPESAGRSVGVRS